MKYFKYSVCKIVSIGYMSALHKPSNGAIVTLFNNGRIFEYKICPLKKRWLLLITPDSLTDCTENNLPVLDKAREEALINKNVSYLNDKELEKYYLTFLEGMLTASKDYQKDLM